MNVQMIVLGVTYRDKVTGFKGVCTGQVRYLSGCNQALITPHCRDDGSYVEAQWFDEQRLDEVEGVDRIFLDNGNTPGFDTQAPKR